MNGIGKALAYSFDARGMVQATQDPLAACTTYQFDAAGNTVLRVDARSWPTTYTVDALNRVTGQLYRQRGRGKELAA